MDDLDTALERLERAVDGLETALVRAVRRGGGHGGGEVAAERDRLRAEVDELRAAARRDAELRDEAAAAVKAALADLKALMPEEGAHG
jgi:molybdenum-dependent DNA-binding transcriptional regulator ModE